MSAPPTALGECSQRPITGIEVHPITGVGWQIIHTWKGERGGFHGIFVTREQANQYAASLFENVCLAVERQVGQRPYLKLAEGSA